MADFDVEILTGREGLDHIAGDWEDLCRRAGAPGFHGPAYVRAYLHAAETEAAGVFVVARRGGALVAVAPLYRQTRRWAGRRYRTLTSASHAGLFCYDFAVEPGAASAAAPMWQALAACADWDVLELRNLIAERSHASQWLMEARAAGWSVLARAATPSPWLDLRSPQALNGHFRRTLGRTRRQLESLGEPRLEHVASVGETEVAAYWRMEASGWKGAAANARWYPAAELTFLSRAASVLQLYRLQLGDETIAQLLTVSTAQQCHAGRITYDRGFARFGPGHLLLQAVVADLRRRGVDEFHLGAGADDFKLRWTGERLLHGRWLVVRPRGPARWLGAAQPLISLNDRRGRLAGSLRRHGPRATLRMGWGWMRWRTHDLAIDSWYRRGDRRFDRQHGTRTAVHPYIPEGPDEPGSRVGYGYGPTPERRFRRALGRLEISRGDFTFIDLGCGKGKALILAAELGFERVIGVEASPEMAALARHNIERVDAGAGSRLEVITCEAGEYEFPLKPLVVYLYDPFDAAVLQRVIARLAASLQAAARPVHLVYMRPSHAEVLEQSGLLRRVVRRRGYAIYVAQSENP